MNTAVSSDRGITKQYDPDLTAPKARLNWAFEAKIESRKPLTSFL